MVKFKVGDKVIVTKSCSMSDVPAGYRVGERHIVLTVFLNSIETRNVSNGTTNGWDNVCFKLAEPKPARNLPAWF